MLDWLAKNKEWVFSGVGVTALAAIAFLIKLIYARFSHRDTPSVKIEGELATQPRAVEVDKTGDVLSSAEAAAEASQAPATSVHKTSDTLNSGKAPSLPSANEIALAVESAPPFQQEQVAACYVGLVVSWPVVFKQLTTLQKSHVLVQFGYGTGIQDAVVIAVVDIAQYPRLKTATAPSEVTSSDGKVTGVFGWIEGTIVECDSLFGIRIKLTKLEFFN